MYFLLIRLHKKLSYTNRSRSTSYNSPAGQMRRYK